MLNGTDRTDQWLHWIKRVHGVTVAAACVSVPLIYAPVFSSYFVPKQALLFVFCALSLALWMVHCSLERECVLPDVRWLRPLGLYLVFAALSLVQAVNTYAGVEELARQMALWAVALSVALYSDERTLRLVVGAVAGTALTASLLGILQYAGIHWIPAPHERYGNLGVSTFGNTNFAAHYLDIAIPFLLGAALASKRIWQRALIWFSVLSCAYYMLLTQSRGGWIALAVGLCFLGWKVGRRTVRHISLSMMLALGIVAGVAGEIALRSTYDGNNTESFLRGWQGLADRVVERVETLGDAKHISINQRRLIWADTVDLIKDRPWWGVGIGNYAVALPTYRTVERHEEWRPYLGGAFPLRPQYAHNEYLTVWAESGLWSLLSWMAVWITVAMRSWTTVTACQDERRQILLWSMWAALLAASIHACFSFNLHDPTSSLHLWVLVGLLEAQRAGGVRKWTIPSWMRSALVLGALVSLGGSLYWGASTLMGDYYYFQGKRYYYAAGQPNRSYLAFRNAVNWRESSANYQHMLGFAALHIGRLGEAEHALERSLDLNPNSPEGMRLLGQVFDRQGRAERGVDLLSRASELEPLRADGYERLAHSLREAARLESAPESVGRLREREIQAWRQALALAPSNANYALGLGLALSGAGRRDEAVAALEKAERLDARNAIIMGNLGALYLQIGRRERAEVLLTRAAEADPQRAEWWGNLGLLYSAQGELERAEKVVREAVARSPEAAIWHVQLVDLLINQGKVNLAWQAVAQGIQHHPSHEGLLKRAQAIAHTAQKGER